MKNLSTNVVAIPGLLQKLNIEHFNYFLIIFRCINTVGSYECECLIGYSGDAKINGTGCIDSKPPYLSCIGKGCSQMNFKVSYLEE